MINALRQLIYPLNQAIAWEEEHVGLKPRKRVPLTALAEQTIDPANIESMKNHAATFTKSHVSAIKSYKGASGEININLREGTDPDEYYRKHTIRLKHVTSHRLQVPQTTYRSSYMESALPVGTIFTDKGFSGTSLSPHIYTSFDSSVLDDDDRKLGFAIHAPKGAKGYHLDRHKNGNSKEKEFLYHPNTHYKVIGHSKHRHAGKKYNITHVAIIGQGYNGRKKDLSLTKSPEGKAWLDSIKKNHIDIISAKTKAPVKKPKVTKLKVK